MKKYFIGLIIIVLCINLSCVRKSKYAVVISANMEWKALKKVYPNENFKKSVYGEYFFKKIQNKDVLFFHEGWGKVSAAGATQYIIDLYKPEIIINIGTCGGFEGDINQFDIILADKTIIYDIIEAMGDSKGAIADYTTQIDLTWLGNNYPSKVIKTTLLSADKDLKVDEIIKLKNEYSAIVGDWETGAIAYIAQRNKKKIIILRGVSDLVSDQRGEAYGNFNLFIQRTDSVMKNLLIELPKWISYIENIDKAKK
jgi:adenosylhomocysteine nucleosidase